MEFLSANSHLNAVVRKCTAQHLANLVEKVGASRLLSAGKDITDRLLPAVIKLTQDSSQEARYEAQLLIILVIFWCFSLYFITWQWRGRHGDKLRTVMWHEQ